VRNALLTNLRKRIEGLTSLIAKPFCRLGVHPNWITLSSTIVLITGLLLLMANKPLWVFIVAIILSGILDALDGAVARNCGKTSLLGSFLDSTVDRVNDFIIIASLLAVGFDEFIVLALMSAAFLTSYVRAKAESLGLRMEGVGIVERAERILLVTLVLITSSWDRFTASIILYALLVLSLLTVVQRIFYVAKSLTRIL
jgi:archaetidylinositol phosphate synthase